MGQYTSSAQPPLFVNKGVNQVIQLHSMNKIIGYFLHNRLITALVLILIIIGGLSTVPFNWHSGLIPRNPVAVDAIPDIGDNQQIIATDWMGRSPKDIKSKSHTP